MAVLKANGKILIKTIGGFEGITVRQITSPIYGIKYADKFGYIGGDVQDYFYPNTYNYNNFVIVIDGADFSNEGLGQVTFIPVAGTVSIGGKVYKTVNIQGVEWLAENLDYKFPGVTIGSSVISSSNPQANYFDNDEVSYGWNGMKFGLLYNWSAVNLLEQNKATLIPGWHVPSSSEWDSLANSIGGSSMAGKFLKAKNLNWASNWNGIDIYGFSVLPVGSLREPSPGSFVYLGTYANYWTATKNTSSKANNMYFDIENRLGSYPDPFERCYSLRLVKDSA